MRLGSVAIALLLLLGRDQIKAGEMTIGSFISFLIAVFTLYDPVRKFALFYNSFQQALGASEEIFNLWMRRMMCARRSERLCCEDLEQGIAVRGCGIRVCERGRGEAGAARYQADGAAGER